MQRLLILASLVVACAPNRAPPRQPGRVVAYQPYLVNFVPFGAGQFQNGDRGKGTALAIGEGVTAATSVSIFTYLMMRYGAGEVAPEDASRVRSMQQLEVATGVAFFGLYAVGVIDAVINYRPRDVLLAPLVIPNGGGVAITWSR